jgi:hypothetical protein
MAASSWMRCTSMIWPTSSRESGMPTSANSRSVSMLADSGVR